MPRISLRRPLMALATLLLAVGGSLVPASPAQAASNGPTSGDGWVAITWYASAGGRCQGNLDYLSNYAYGLYTNAGVAVGCTFWIERSNDGGYTWPSVFYTKSLSSSSGSYSSPPVLDSPPSYLARVCFHFNVAAAAKHCSYGI